MTPTFQHTTTPFHTIIYRVAFQDWQASVDQKDKKERLLGRALAVMMITIMMMMSFFKAKSSRL
jgi:hypothetical protein